MEFKNLSELAATLPNGLHDAEITSISFDYVTRIAAFTVTPVPGPSQPARSVKIIFHDVKFLAIDPPDPARDFASSGSLTVNIQPSSPELLPMLPKYKAELGATNIYSIYADELNGFVHIGSGSVELK